MSKSQGDGNDELELNNQTLLTYNEEGMVDNDEFFLPSHARTRNNNYNTGTCSILHSTALITNTTLYISFKDMHTITTIMCVVTLY